jgi:hypothetical protein
MLNKSIPCRQKADPFCNVIYAARYPCVFGPRNAACRVLSAVLSYVLHASESVTLRTGPSPGTVSTSSHVPHILRGSVENT